MRVVSKKVAPKFESFLFDWDYETYLLMGGYGSGKSYNVELKIILKCLSEKRKVLVVREVFETLKESCFDLFVEILSDLDLVSEGNNRDTSKVIVKLSPLEIRFPNGSRIIFKGMDKPTKMKSINGVSIIWLEECTEIKYDGYKELLGRLRTPNESMHIFLTFNPVGRENWVYRHFFVNIDDNGKETIIQDEEEFYRLQTLINPTNGIYYSHSIPEDNPFLPKAYIKRLDGIKAYDEPLYNVARWGRFGANGTRVLPQLIVAKNKNLFISEVQRLGVSNQFFGFDFGFEESYNAVISMTVDIEHSILYIWDEVYMNKLTDDKFASTDQMQKLKSRLEEYKSGKMPKMIIADSEDPKAIQYYRQLGFQIRGCRNRFAGSRLSNTKKIKRFKSIIVSPKCKNTIRELKELTYKKDSKGNVIYDQFNIDPHTFSAIWYGLDMVTVADVKEKKFNSKRGD